jgi:hypothetical protein
MDNSILEQLKAQNITVKHIYTALKVTRGAVYNSINGLGSRDIRIVIAHLLNKKPSELWHDNVHKVVVLDDALFNARHKTSLLLVDKVIKECGNNL